MCGIVSIISRRNNGFWAADLSIMETMLTLDTLRGMDSTGVFSVDSSRNIGIMKVASHPFHLFACDGWKKWRGKAVSNGRIIVGHNRKATQGAIKSENAHPFRENNIVLVHNGTLRGDHRKIADTEVDSHALAVAFNEKGAENVIPTIDGAFALVWWDMEKNRLFAVRNEERPLQLVVTDELYVLASEAWMAQAALGRENRQVKEIITIEPGQLYEFEIGGKMAVKSVEVKEPPNYTSYTTNGVYRGHTVPKDTGATTGTGKTTSLTVVRNQPPASAGLRRLAASFCPNQGGTSETTAADPELPRIDVINGHVNCEDYPKGAEVLLKVYELTESNNKQFYHVKGKTLEPGCEPIDFIGYMKLSDVPNGNTSNFLRNPVLGTVLKHSSTTCGRSLFVSKLRVPLQYETYNGRLTEHEWSHVITHCKCTVCNAPIYDEEQRFTNVFRHDGNKYSAICADCVEDNLKGDAKYAFTQDRLTTLQASQQLGNQSTAGSIDSIAGPGSQTLQ